MVASLIACGVLDAARSDGRSLSIRHSALRGYAWRATSSVGVSESVYE